MLLREKYDVLINVTWDCFDQSNFYISRINIIEWNKIVYIIMLLSESLSYNIFFNVPSDKVAFCFCIDGCGK
jgi:hypothetical protein